MRKHFQDQESRYGTLRLVNLVNQVGHEEPVKEAYERYLAQAIFFFWFSIA
jgi:phosphatidylinositol 4-phosphatase